MLTIEGNGAAILGRDFNNLKKEYGLDSFSNFRVLWLNQKDTPVDITCDNCEFLIFTFDKLDSFKLDFGSSGFTKIDFVTVGDPNIIKSLQEKETKYFTERIQFVLYVYQNIVSNALCDPYLPNVIDIYDSDLLLRIGAYDYNFNIKKSVNYSTCFINIYGFNVSIDKEERFNISYK